MALAVFGPGSIHTCLGTGQPYNMMIDANSRQRTGSQAITEGFQRGFS